MDIMEQLNAFWPIILMVVIFYFLLWRPQKKQQKKRRKRLRPEEGRLNHGKINKGRYSCLSR